MKNLSKVLMVAMLGVGLAMVVCSCEKGPAEKVGEKIDNGVQDLKDAVRK